MSKILISLFAVCCFAAAAQPPAPGPAPEVPKTAKHTMTREVLLEKIKQAADPEDAAKNWKTMLIKMQMGAPMQQLSFSVTGMYKFPDKAKLIAEMPGLPVITEVFDGKQAWKEVAGLGIQMKTDEQLAFAEFECRKSNPALELTDIYEKVELDPYLYQAGGFSCYKLLCYPPEKLKMPPTQLFVDAKEFLARYSIENQLSEMGMVQVAATISDYKVVEGVKVPMLMEMDMMGIKMQAKLLSIKINEAVPDTEFRFPESKEPETQKPETEKPEPQGAEVKDDK